MHTHTAVRIKGSLWEAIAQRAESEQLSSEDWLNHQIEKSDPATPPSAPDDDLLLDLAIRHFRDLNLTSNEAQQLSAAILQTVTTGEPMTVGPIGALDRRYIFHRRVAAVSIRVGEGRIRLPVTAALRLASVLQVSNPARDAVAA